MNVEAPLRLKLTGVSKSFPGVRANDNVNSERQARRDSRAARRERRGKIDAGQDDLRHPRARRGRDRLRRLARPHLQSARGSPARHRHGVPALLAVRGDDGAREHRARPRFAPLLARTSGRVQSGARGLPAQARSSPRRLDAERRRAPAHRDRARAPAQPPAPDHGRADLGADAAGSRAIVRDLAKTGGERLLDPLHLPQAARDRGALRHRDHPARRQGGRPLRPEARDLALDGRDDDRRQPEGNRQARQPRLRPAQAHGARLEPAEAERIRRRAAGRRARASGPARSSASPASPETDRTNS